VLKDFLAVGAGLGADRFHQFQVCAFSGATRWRLGTLRLDCDWGYDPPASQLTRAGHSRG